MVESRGCCRKRRDVFVFSGYGLVEYAHGGTKPLRTLHSGDIPLGCAVDPLERQDVAKPASERGERCGSSAQLAERVASNGPISQ
jgi:hypothetical protein